MSTAICFKSESSDYYQFLTDSTDEQLVEDELGARWYVESEYLYVVTFASDDFDDSVVQMIVNDTVNKI